MQRINATKFKQQCLSILDGLDSDGLVITKRGKPTAKLIPLKKPEKKEPFIGRLEGIIEIVGDPDDLIRPIFPPEDWDMLK